MSSTVKKIKLDKSCQFDDTLISRDYDANLCSVLVTIETKCKKAFSNALHIEYAFNKIAALVSEIYYYDFWAF